MRRRHLKWIFLLLAFGLLCSCGSGGQGDPSSASTPQGEIPQSTPAPQAEDGPSIVVRSLGSFSSGRAWVDFSYEGEDGRYLGCIDKDGSLLFAFEKDSIQKIRPL